MSRLRTAGQLIILTVIACALLWPAPVDPAQLPAVFPNSDLLLSHWSSALLIKDTIVHTHQLPLWNPYFAGGFPVAGDPLAALFYPPTHLADFLPTRQYLLVVMIGHLVFGGLGTLLLARVALGLSPIPSLISAIAFIAAPRLVGHLGAGHLTMFQTVTWFPWVALACWAATRKPAIWSVPLAFSLALLILAGHPQPAYYGILMVTILPAWQIAGRWRAGGKRAAAKAALGLGSAAVLAGLLASAYLLPLLELTAHSTRQTSVHTTDTLPLRTFLDAIVGIRVPWEQRPDGVPHEVLFEPGLVVLALATIGVVARRRVGFPLLLSVIVISGIALGLSAPFYRFAALVLPEFERFRGVARIWFVALVPIALLAGLGVEPLLERAKRFPRLSSTALSVALVGAVAFNLIWINQGLTRHGGVQPFTQPSDLELTAIKVAGTGRIYGVQRNFRQWIAVDLKAELADGLHPMLIEPYLSFMGRAGGYAINGYQFTIPSAEGQPDAELLGLVDVRAVISDKPLDDPLFIQVTQIGNTYIYDNPESAGRAYLVLPDQLGGPPTIDGIRRLDTLVEEVEHNPERSTFTFTAPAQAFLVIGSTAFPGWIADLDGHPAQLDTIEGVLPAVRVEQGTHRVTYRYAPQVVELGLQMSLAGIMLGLAWLGALALWRRSTRR